MNFDRSWVLFLSWIPLAWAVYEMRRTSRRIGLALRALSFVAVIVALAEPHITLPESKLAVAVLVDTSASATATDLERANTLARNLTSARGSSDRPACNPTVSSGQRDFCVIPCGNDRSTCGSIGAQFFAWHGESNARIVEIRSISANLR